MEKEKTIFEQELSFIEFWNILRRHFILILSTSIIFLILSVINAYLIQVPDYISNADVMVQVEQDSSSSDSNYDLVNAFRLIDTVAELMKKEVILVNALDRLNEMGYGDLSVKYLREGLVVKSSSTSYFINISFIDENTSLAEAVVDSIIEATIEETNVNDAFPVLTDKIRRTSFASEATYNSPNRLLYAVIGLGLGILSSVSFVVIKERLSSKFRNKEEIESLLGVQVLGVIPLMRKGEKQYEKK